MRRLLYVCIPVILLVAVYSFILNGEDNNQSPKSGISPEIASQIDSAVNKGLKFLASSQGKVGSLGQTYPIAVTSLVGLAFLANGNLSREGKYRDNITAARRYIVKSATKTGYICENAQSGGTSRMHGHGFATWFLAELYGECHTSMDEDEEEVKSVIKKAIKTIEESQSKDGGWYYEPHRGGDEGSITVCIVQALRAARNAGIVVNKEVIDKGVNYLKRSANPDGSFKYSLNTGGRSGTFALAAGGVSSLCLYGMYDAPETIKGLEYLMRYKPGSKENWNQGYPYYSNFYATLAMYLSGEKYWNEWFPLLVNDLLKKQQPNGSWIGEIGPEYSTAFTCLMLQIPYQYLPLFQK
jgi:hypothetical protein